LPLPLALQVTDRDTGDGVILDRGSLTNALLASIAAPPLLPPVEIGGRRIIDGALSDPVPRHAAAGEGIDCVISIGTSVAANGLPMQGTAVSRDNNGFHIEIAFDRPIRWWNTHLAPALLEHGRTLADRICGQMERFLASAEIEQRRDRRTERSHR
jgi:predicted acylesterase/phospholipase RssA